MGTIFDSKKSIFKKSKTLMTDGCCEIAEPCCGIGAGLKGGYKVYFNHGLLPSPQEIFDGTGVNATLANGIKWNFYLETTGPVDVQIISISSSPLLLNTLVGSAGNAVYPGLYPIIQSEVGFTGGSFTVTIVTDSGTFTFSANITII
jgi:hypothetical protein